MYEVQFTVSLLSIISFPAQKATLAADYLPRIHICLGATRLNQDTCMESMSSVARFKHNIASKTQPAYALSSFICIFHLIICNILPGYTCM